MRQVDYLKLAIKSALDGAKGTEQKFEITLEETGITEREIKDTMRVHKDKFKDIEVVRYTNVNKFVIRGKTVGPKSINQDMDLVGMELTVRGSEDIADIDEATKGVE